MIDVEHCPCCGNRKIFGEITYKDRSLRRYECGHAQDKETNKTVFFCKNSEEYKSRKQQVINELECLFKMVEKYSISDPYVKKSIMWDIKNTIVNLSIDFNYRFTFEGFNNKNPLFEPFL